MEQKLIADLRSNKRNLWGGVVVLLICAYAGGIWGLGVPIALVAIVFSIIKIVRFKSRLRGDWKAAGRCIGCGKAIEGGEVCSDCR